MKSRHHIKPFEYDDGKYDNGYHDKLVEHRREKRLKNAIKSRNIRDLMDLGDEGTFYY